MTTGDPHFHMRFWPTQRFGRWAVGSAAAFVAGQVAEVLAVASGQDRGVTGTIFGNWWLAGPALVSVVGGLSALVSGIVALIREHDRSIAVALSTLVGLLVALFLIFAE